MSLKFSGGYLRRVSYMYNFAGVLDLVALAALAGLTIGIQKIRR
jgi:hypothetical protein